MKIKRFKQINEAKMTKEIEEFVKNFHDSTDWGVITWITYVAPKGSEYELLDVAFANKYNLKKLSEFIQIEKSIEIKEKELKRLENRKNRLELEASNEALYKFQEYLLDTDFEKFKEFFMIDIDEYDTEEEKISYSDIHPDIIKKHKDEILLKMSAHKYNL
jgi:hypothetical protein